MNTFKIMTATLTLATAVPATATGSDPVIGKNQIALTGDRLTPEAFMGDGTA